MSVTARTTAAFVGAAIHVKDARTGGIYAAKIFDAKESYGKLRLSIVDGCWFEPTAAEVASVTLGKSGQAGQK